MQRLKQLYWSLIIIFLLIAAFFVIPWPDELRRSLFLVAAVLALIFLIIGAILLYLTIKSKLPKNHKVALILVASPAIAFLASVILHNFLYALAVISKDLPILPHIFEFLHATFFLLGLLGAPIIFIIGAIWSGILFYKKRPAT
jgi:hypothetical protein